MSNPAIKKRYPVSSIIKGLYKGRTVSYYYNVREHTKRKGIMQSHLAAASDFLRFSQKFGKKPLVVTALAPMSGGKSTLLCLVAEKIADVSAFKHSLDIKRSGPDIINHSHKVKISAKHYQKVQDILKQLDRVKVILVDELQFAQNTKKEIYIFIKQLRKLGKHVLLAGLNLDFAKRPWVTTTAALEKADYAFELAARCAYPKCAIPASFTQRMIDGIPAAIDDPLIVVGGVGRGDLYDSRCFRHHVVKPPSKL